MAIKAFKDSKKMASSISPKLLRYGANKGAINCELNLGGEVILGANLKKKNRRLNFCLFKDRSLIQASALK